MSDDCDLDCGDVDCGECFCLCCCDGGGGGDGDSSYGGSSSGHGSDAPCHSLRCCCIILIFLAAVALILTITALTVHPVHVELQDASLARFALTGPNGTTLAYDVSLVVAMHNRGNWAMRAKPGALDAELLFDGKSFAHVRLLQESSRGIKPGRAEVYHVAVAGETTQLGSTGLAEFVKENAAGGVFRLELKLASDVRYPPHRGMHKLDATCPLKLPLSSAAAVTRFTKIKCV